MSIRSPSEHLATRSTPESFYTAKDSPPVGGADTTGISSPIEDDAAEPRYRNAVQPPHELKVHCQIHLEEELCEREIPCLVYMNE